MLVKRINAFQQGHNRVLSHFCEVCLLSGMPIIRWPHFLIAIINTSNDFYPTHPFHNNKIRDDSYEIIKIIIFRLLHILYQDKGFIQFINFIAI